MDRPAPGQSKGILVHCNGCRDVRSYREHDPGSSSRWDGGMCALQDPPGYRTRLSSGRLRCSFCFGGVAALDPDLVLLHRLYAFSQRARTDSLFFVLRAGSYGYDRSGFRCQPLHAVRVLRGLDPGHLSAGGAQRDGRGQSWRAQVRDLSFRGRPRSFWWPPSF